MADLKYEVKIDFGSIGGKKKLTFTSWNDNAPRYDIRDWYENNVGKGITLDKDELKNLYELLSTMFEDESEEAVENPWDSEEEEQTTLFDESVIEELTDLIKGESESKYPKKVQKAFNELDKLFKGFKTEKAYGKMPFADGDRLQYSVTKGKKAFPDYEAKLDELELKSFITNKGNLYIYTL